MGSRKTEKKWGVSMISSNFEDGNSVRSSMNYVPGVELWNFNLNSVAKFYATDTRQKQPTISMDLNIGIRDRKNNSTMIDKSHATVTFQLDTIEIMDFASFLLGFRQSVLFTRNDKQIRLERQQHFTASQSLRSTPIPEWKIYLAASAQWLDRPITMSLLQNRAACIAALTLSQLNKQYKDVLPPELLLASVRNFQSSDIAGASPAPVDTSEEHFPQPNSVDEQPNAKRDSRQSHEPKSTNIDEEAMARTPPRPRNKK